jgi:DNA repair protein RadD
MVEVPCPKCGITNNFWGVTDEEGEVIEHFGRKCKAAFEDPQTKELHPCDFRFRFKLCPECGEENDIAARVCNACTHLLVDTDKRLKEAMSLKDAHVLRVDSVVYQKGYDKKGNERLEIKYYDVDAKFLTEYFYINSKEDAHAFYFNFIRMHNRRPEKKIFVKDVDDAIAQKEKFRAPMFVVARKQKYYWNIREKIFE